jgi:hypothetical protein
MLGAMRSPSKRRRRSKVAREMRAEYDFRGGVRGKYAAQFAEGTNLVLLEPDVARRFPTSADVNRALRMLIGGTGHAAAP